ncbi:hypothetical protein HUJ04_009544 [Dendroctonus ponderosae]
MLRPVLYAVFISSAIALPETGWYPKYHIAPQHGWMNDPNGLIYFQGFYHVFWQYNPAAPQWGLMHWGHARSPDLLTWEHLPIALAPSLPGDIDGAFSGSAVLLNETLTLIYTGVSENGTRQVQMVATSQDGVAFEKLGVVIGGNETNFRDPKAWWQDGSWYVVIGAQTADERGQVSLYSSPDFFNWTPQGVLAQADPSLGYMWECPDFFSLEGKQVLVVNPQGIQSKGEDFQNLFQTGYFVGSWAPGGNFAVERGFRELDHGHDFYASQTFEAPDGRRLEIGWLGMWESQFPENASGWAGMLSLPRELTLSDQGDLEVRPLREIQSLRTERLEVPQTLHIAPGGGVAILQNISHSEVALDFKLHNSSSNSFAIQLTKESFERDGGAQVHVDRNCSRVFLERHYPAYNITRSSRSVAVNLTGNLSLDIFIDGSSMEVFVNDGQAVMSSRIYPDAELRTFLITAQNGSVAVDRLKVWDL